MGWGGLSRLSENRKGVNTSANFTYLHTIMFTDIRGKTGDISTSQIDMGDYLKVEPKASIHSLSKARLNNSSSSPCCLPISTSHSSKQNPTPSFTLDTHTTMDIHTLMDEETATLILQLEFEDAQELAAAIESKSKGKEGELSDAQLALALYRDEIECRYSIIRDRAITSSIARACQADGALVTSSLSQELTAARDRDAAYRFGSARLPALIGPSQAVEVLDDETIERLSTLYIGDPADVPRVEHQRSRPCLDIDDSNGESSVS